ncbi:MAG: hypothetical protein HQL32_00335 [Planctomycetes bacterium]|nr:hypothetical protein [Planctomycetota bacterium]
MKTSTYIAGLSTLFILCALALYCLKFITHSTTSLKQSIDIIQSELEQLPHESQNHIPWTLGYRSLSAPTPDKSNIIEITFAKKAKVDLIAIMPATYTTNGRNLMSFGFPENFILEGICDDGSTTLIADYGTSLYPTPGIEPQLFPCSRAKMISGLRLTVTHYPKNPTWWDSSHVLALSEIYAFEGEWNVSLNGEVKASTSNDFYYVWSEKCLVDGFSIFSPINIKSFSPLGSSFTHKETCKYIFDYGNEVEIDEMRLWPVIHSLQHNYPPASGLGFPLEFSLEASSSIDFNDAQVIYESPENFPKPGANPYMCKVKPTEARYYRLNLSEGLIDHRSGFKKIELAEAQLLQKGKVMITDSEVQMIAENKNRKNIKRQYAANLTDGYSNGGIILPLRLWVEQFTRRVQLKKQMGKLQLDLQLAQRQERERLLFSIIVSITLITILILAIWLVRLIAARQWTQMREQIANDLHDEIGANMSSVAHSTELVLESVTPTKKIHELLSNVIQTARTTAQQTRQIIRFLEKDNKNSDFIDDLKQISPQILGTIPSHFSLHDTKSFNSLSIKAQWHLLLFYKEALNNIIKHAKSENVTITTKAVKSHLQMTVSDDGCGLPDPAPSLLHLEKRANELKGRLQIESQPGQGTQITLLFSP